MIVDQLVAYTVRKISRKMEKLVILQDIIHYSLSVVTLLPKIQYIIEKAGKNPVKNQSFILTQ